MHATLLRRPAPFDIPSTAEDVLPDSPRDYTVFGKVWTVITVSTDEWTYTVRDAANPSFIYQRRMTATSLKPTVAISVHLTPFLHGNVYSVIVQTKVSQAQCYVAPVLSLRAMSRSASLMR